MLFVGQKLGAGIGLKLTEKRPTLSVYEIDRYFNCYESHQTFMYLTDRAISFEKLFLVEKLGVGVRPNW